MRSRKLNPRNPAIAENGVYLLQDQILPVMQRCGMRWRSGDFQRRFRRFAILGFAVVHFRGLGLRGQVLADNLGPMLDHAAQRDIFFRAILPHDAGCGF